MKKIIAILLFFVLGLSIFGLYPLLKIMQYQARLEMAIRIRNGVPGKDLHVFIFSTNEPEWTKKGKEFIHDGHLYDIVEMKKKGDSTIFLCLKDTKETRLNQHLKRIAEKDRHNDFQNKDNQNRPTNFYKFQYVSGMMPWKSVMEVHKILPFLFQQNYNSTFFPPPVPPPEVSDLV